MVSDTSKLELKRILQERHDLDVKDSEVDDIALFIIRFYLFGALRTQGGDTGIRQEYNEIVYKA